MKASVARGLAAQRVRLYQRTAGWLFVDLWRNYWGSMLALVGFSVLAVVGRIATFGGLAGGLGHLVADGGAGQDRSLSMPGGGLIEALGLAGLGILVGLAALAAAVARYFEGRLQVRIGEKYAQLAMTRMVGWLSEGRQDLLADVDEDSSGSPAQKLLGGDAMILVRAVKAVTGVLFPAILVVMSGIVAFVLSWQLASLFIALAPVYMFFFIRLNQRVARASARRDKKSKAHRSETVSIANLLSLQQYATSLGPEVGRKHVYSKGARGRLSMLEELLMSRPRVELLNGLAILIGVLLIILYAVATKSWQGGGDLARLAMFAITLRLGSMGATGVSASIAGFSRFLPQFRRYVDFHRGSEEGGLRPGDSSIVEIRVVESNHPQGDLCCVRLEGGQCCFVQEEEGIRPQTLPGWWRGLTGRRRVDDVILIPRPADLPNISVSQLLTGVADPATSDVEAALGWMDSASASTVHELLFGGAPSVRTWWEMKPHLDVQTQCAVAASGIRLRPSSWCVINAGTLAGLRSGLKEAFMREAMVAGERDLLVVGRRANQIPIEAGVVVVRSEGCTIAVGSVSCAQALLAAGNVEGADAGAEANPEDVRAENDDDDDLE